MTAALLASAEDSGTRAVLRHNLDAEAGILGGILLDNSVMERLDSLAVEDFWDPKHRMVFAAMRHLAAACRPIDVLTVEVQIADSGKLDAIGGPGFLGELVLRVPTPDNVAAYSDDVKRLARNRASEVMLAGALHRIRSGAIEPEDVVTETAGELARFAEDLRSDARSSLEYGRAFREFVGTDEPDENPADVFDAHGLIVTGEPSLLVGDPKVGKTLLLTDLLLHMAAGRREWCGVSIYRRPRMMLFLREDSERTTTRRIWQLARGARIEHWELADHLVIDGTSPLYFDDAKLTTKLEKQLACFDICAIDSLSTIHNADENSAERMAPIMNRWRDLSLGTRTAIVLVHHFRKRGNDAPTSAPGGPVLQRARLEHHWRDDAARCRSRPRPRGAPTRHLHRIEPRGRHEAIRHPPPVRGRRCRTQVHLPRARRQRARRPRREGHRQGGSGRGRGCAACRARGHRQARPSHQGARPAAGRRRRGEERGDR